MWFLNLKDALFTIEMAKWGMFHYTISTKRRASVPFQAKHTQTESSSKGPSPMLCCVLSCARGVRGLWFAKISRFFQPELQIPSAALVSLCFRLPPDIWTRLSHSQPGGVECHTQSHSLHLRADTLVLSYKAPGFFSAEDTLSTAGQVEQSSLIVTRLLRTVIQLQFSF